MIVTPSLETGVGDIEGVVAADILRASGAECLCDEWQRLRREGFGGVFLVVRDLDCPFQGVGEWEFLGTYQLLTFLERALQRRNLSESVVFRFQRIETPQETPKYFGWTSTSLHLGREEDWQEVAATLRGLYARLVSRGRLRDLPEQDHEFSKLTETGSADFASHTLMDASFRRKLEFQGVHFELVAVPSSQSDGAEIASTKNKDEA